MTGRVYIGGLSHRTGSRDIERFLRNYGKILDISIKNGYAFIEFHDRRDAEDAVEELQGKDLCGDRIILELARGTPHGRDRERWGPANRSRRSRSPNRGSSRPVWVEKYGAPHRTEYRLIVENLSSSISWQDLKDTMRRAGDVTFADAHRDVRGEGVVEFSRYDDMLRAIEKFDNYELGSRRIKLVNDYKRRGRSDSRSRSRSRSRSPSSPRRNDRRSYDSRSRSRSRTRSPAGRRSGGRRKSRSASPEERRRSVSKSRSRSRSPRSRSQSRERYSREERERSRRSDASRDSRSHVD